MKKVGYVLSGGGARGFAHLGMLQFLEELNIKPHAIAATSVGAAMAALYAVGKSPKEIMELLKKNNYFGWSNLSLNGSGLFSMDVLRKLLKEEVPEDDFAALPIKLFVAATDLNKGESIIFSEGKLFHTIVASASIPVLFKPVIIGEKVLVDGGLLNNFPVEPLLPHCNVIIGSHVNKMEGGLRSASLLKTFNILERCFHLAISQQVHAKTNLCNVFLEPSLQAFDMYDIKQADKIFTIGYETAAAFKKEILKAMQAQPLASEKETQAVYAL